MRTNIAKILGLLLVMTLTFLGQSFADENENQALKSEVKDLNSKVSALERQVQALTSAPRESQTTYVPSTKEGGALKGITVSGFVDTQYNNNLSRHVTNPSVSGGAGNPLRSFDNNQNTFTMNNTEIDIEKLANPEGGAGFRVDLSAGEDMRAIDGSTVGGSGATSKMGFQQAYVQLVAPLHVFDGSDVFGNAIDVKAGRFVTLAGAEVIEGKDNWNISRSFLFGLGIPFTHTGVRATYGLFKNKVTTYFGLNNGWDANVDNNTWKTWELGWTANPLDKVSFTQAIYFGPENALSEGRKRFLLSNVASFQATDKLAFKGEFTFGRQNRIGTGNGFLDNGQWFGIAGYARYAFTDKWGMSYRWELFRDKDRFRTGAATGAGNASLATSTVWEQTFGADYKIYDNLLGRVEYRFDKSNEGNIFNGQHSQSTLGAQLIYSFA